MTQTPQPVTACLIIIGNEILSGRTVDANLPYIAQKLGAIGIRMMEVRVVPDVEAVIVEAVNACRASVSTMSSRPAASGRPMTTSPRPRSPGPSGALTGGIPRPSGGCSPTTRPSASTRRA